MVVRILALVLLLGMGVQAQSINKGIDIGHLNYDGGDIYVNDTAKNRLIGKSFDIVVSGGGGLSDPVKMQALLNMKTSNPSLITFAYETFQRASGMAQDSGSTFANDSALIRNYVGSTANYNKLFLFNVSASSITIDEGIYSAVLGPNTFPAGAMVQPEFFGANQFRMQWDLREYKAIAGVLAYLYDTKYFGAGTYTNSLNGNMVDEESFISNGIYGSETGMQTPWYPWRNLTGAGNNIYITGTYQSIGNSSKSPDWKDVGLSFSQVGDSLHKLRLLLWAHLQDSLTARRAGKTYMLNFGGNLDPNSGENNSRWDSQGQYIADSVPYVLLGEFTDFMPVYVDNSSFITYRWIPDMMSALRATRNRGHRHFVWASRSLGPSDTTGVTDTTVTMGEVKLIHLGAWLLCTFPGTTNATWAIARQTYATNWAAFTNTRGWGPEYRYFYDTAFSFYNGVATIDRDSTSGTDGNGVPYKVYSGIFLRPNSTDSLTWVAVRTRRKVTDGGAATTGPVAGSKVNIVVPGSSGRNWYRLRSGRRWDTTPIAGGSTVRIANGEAIILSSDTTLANSGPSLTPSVGSVIIDSVRNDFSLEVDSIRLRLTAASSGSIDSIITAVNYVGFTTLDSSVANNDSTSFRRAVTSSGQTYSYYLLPGIGGGTGRSETYTVYVKSWHRQSTTGWSVAYQASRTYTVGQVAGPLSGFAAKEKGKLKNIGRTAIKRQP